MNKYGLVILLPNGQEIKAVVHGDSVNEVKEKYERLFTFDYDEGLWVYDTFLPEDVIKNSIFTIKEL